MKGTAQERLQDFLRWRNREVRPGRLSSDDAHDLTEIVLLARREERGRCLDSITGNIFADWLEEQGEAGAAAKLRHAFPYDPATSEMLLLRAIKERILDIFCTDEGDLERATLLQRMNDPASLDASAFGINGKGK